MKRSVIIGCLFIMLFSTVMNSQNVTVRAVLDTNKALIEDQLKLHILVEKPEGSWMVKFPVLKDTLSDKIEIISDSRIDTVPTGTGRVSLKKDIVISVFDTGHFEIPPIVFSINKDKFSDTLATLPVGFDILSVKADSTIHDIKAIYKAPITAKEIAPYLLGFVILVLLAWLLVYYVNRRKQAVKGKALQMQKRPVPSEPADIIALRELEQLKSEKPWMNNNIKFYYIRISEILRLYVERRFNIPALEQTTDEILFSLKSQHIEQADFNRLSAVLKLSDLVKFARLRPDVTENAVQVDTAIDFVRNTRIVPEPESTEKKKDETTSDVNN